MRSACRRWSRSISTSPTPRSWRSASSTPIFNIVSLITTTGYANYDYLQWGPFAIAIVFMATFLGGCSGSTAGGVKAYRWIALYGIMRRALDRFIYPNAVASVRSGRDTVDEETLDIVLLFFTAFILLWSLLTVALTLTGTDFITSMSGILTALANVGPGLGDGDRPAGNFAPLPDMAKWILSFAMLLGRLEIFTVLVLLPPRSGGSEERSAAADEKPTIWLFERRTPGAIAKGRSGSAGPAPQSPPNANQTPPGLRMHGDGLRIGGIALAPRIAAPHQPRNQRAGLADGKMQIFGNLPRPAAIGASDKQFYAGPVDDADPVAVVDEVHRLVDPVLEIAHGGLELGDGQLCNTRTSGHAKHGHLPQDCLTPPRPF
jgi:hypothetical protein